MHFGNMKFKQKQREEQAEAEGTESKHLCYYLLVADSRAVAMLVCCIASNHIHDV